MRRWVSRLLNRSRWFEGLRRNVVIQGVEASGYKEKRTRSKRERERGSERETTTRGDPRPRIPGSGVSGCGWADVDGQGRRDVAWGPRHGPRCRFQIIV